MWFTEAGSSNWVPMATKDLKELRLPWKMQGEVSLRSRPGTCWEGFVPLLGPVQFTPGPQKHLLGCTCMPHGEPVPRGSGIFHVPHPGHHLACLYLSFLLHGVGCFSFSLSKVPLSVHSLSLELSCGVLHYLAPLIGWPGGAIATGRCGGSTQEEL